MVLRLNRWFSTKMVGFSARIIRSAPFSTSTSAPSTSIFIHSQCSMPDESKKSSSLSTRMTSLSILSPSGFVALNSCVDALSHPERS